jgi:hypothetical protein
MKITLTALVKRRVRGSGDIATIKQVADALDAITIQAEAGTLLTYGRMGGNVVPYSWTGVCFRRRPMGKWERIKPDYWVTHRLDLLRFLETRILGSCSNNGIANFAEVGVRLWRWNVRTAIGPKDPQPVRNDIPFVANSAYWRSFWCAWETRARDGSTEPSGESVNGAMGSDPANSQSVPKPQPRD